MSLKLLRELRFMAAHTPQTNYSIRTTRNEVATENLQINRRRKKREKDVWDEQYKERREENEMVAENEEEKD